MGLLSSSLHSKSILPTHMPDEEKLTTTFFRVGSDIAIVPDWSAGSKDSSLQARAMLKERCDASQPLGLVQSGENELMVVYEGASTLLHYAYRANRIDSHLLSTMR